MRTAPTERPTTRALLVAAVTIGSAVSASNEAALRPVKSESDASVASGVTVVPMSDFVTDLSATTDKGSCKIKVKNSS